MKKIKNEDLIFYQIYPKSFCDGNGDGVGDIQGIVSKIGYLKELGINAVWLSPCFKSPNVDNGYDISDYRDIDPSVGTLKQAEEMIAKFHENGIAVIFDLVANHTSTDHKWFQEARKSKDNPYRDYYIWRETPPNNWQSCFGGSAWEYDEKTGEYYLHSFAIEQADLNWDNPKVREEMKAVVDFWLSKGIDGFRCDVLDMISKDFEKGLNGNGPKLHQYIRELFGREQTDGIFTVGECWSANADNVKAFCLPERKELTTVFAFGHLCIKSRFDREKPSLKEVCKRISNWQIGLQDTKIPVTVFFENHDQPRSVSRFADDKNYRYESATMLGAITLTHRGVPFLFQGQEIGVPNSRHDDPNEFIDVESVNYYKAQKGKMPESELIERINFGGRDNPRHMMPWTADTESVWIAPHSRQKEINVEADENAEKSVFQFYQKLIAIRKNYACMTKGTYELLSLTDGYYAYARELNGERIKIVCNFGAPSKFDGTKNADILLSNYPTVEGTLQPYQTVIYK